MVEGFHPFVGFDVTLHGFPERRALPPATFRTFTCSPQAVRAATAFPRAAHQLGLFRLRAVFSVRGGRTLVLVSPPGPLGLPVTGAALGVSHHNLG